MEEEEEAFRWSKLRSEGLSPSCRHAHSSVIWKDALFIFGGYDVGHHFGDFYAYRLDSGKWSEVKAQGKPPSPRHSHTAVVFQSSMFIFGGIGPKGVLLNDVFEFDFDRFTWHEVPTNDSEGPAGRWGHSATIYGQSMFVFAGLTPKGYTDQLYEFHFNSRSWTRVAVNGNTPSARHFHASCVIGSSLYIFGGFGGKNMNDLHRFDFEKMRWHEIKVTGDSPTPRRGHTMVACGLEYLLAFGGRAATNLNDIALFDITTSSWTSPNAGGSVPTARHFHSASFYKNSMYLFGGIAGKQGSLEDLCRLVPGDSVKFTEDVSDAPRKSIGSPEPSLNIQASVGNASLNSSKLRLKCQFNEEIRILPVSTNVELGDLKKRMKSELSLTSETLQIQYKDEEGDQVTIGTSEELHEAFANAIDQKVKFFKLFIVEVTGSMGSAPQNTRLSNATSAKDSPRQSRARSTPDNVIVGSPSSDIMGPLAGSTRRIPLRYKLGPLLGRGAFGSVYLGLNEVNGELFAVKKIQLDPNQANTRFHIDTLQGEIKLLSRIQHQNVVQYLGSDVERQANILNIFLEYVPGGSLQHMLSKFGPLSERVVWLYAKQILQGLQFLHSRGIVHRDIKSANILVDSAGRVRLSDFGAATSIMNLSTTAAMQDTVVAGQSNLKTFTGTPYWMAPEVIKQSAYGRKCDVWALGCTLYELTTGKPPWSHLAPVSALFKIASEDEPTPEPPSHLSTELQDFITMCMTRNVENRPMVSELLMHEWILEEPPFPDAEDDDDGPIVGSPLVGGGSGSAGRNNNGGLPSPKSPPTRRYRGNPEQSAIFELSEPENEGNEASVSMRLSPRDSKQSEPSAANTASDKGQLPKEALQLAPAGSGFRHEKTKKKRPYKPTVPGQEGPTLSLHLDSTDV